MRSKAKSHQQSQYRFSSKPMKPRKRNLLSIQSNSTRKEEGNISDDHLDELVSIDKKMVNYSTNFVSYPMMNRLCKGSFENDSKIFYPRPSVKMIPSTPFKSKRVFKSRTLHKNRFENSLNEASAEYFGSCESSKEIYLMNKRRGGGKRKNSMHKQMSVLSGFSGYMKSFQKDSKDLQKKVEMLSSRIQLKQNGNHRRPSINIKKKRANLKSLSAYLKKPTPRGAPPLIQTDSIVDSENRNEPIKHNLGATMCKKKKISIKRSFTISKEVEVEKPTSLKVEMKTKKMIKYIKGKEDLFVEVVHCIFRKDIESLQMLLERSKAKQKKEFNCLC